MTVRDQDVADALTARGVRDGIEMGLVHGARVDDRYLTGADEIGVGAQKCVWPRIIGDNAPDARGDVFGYPIVDFGVSIECELG
jgi:hypothetical protein